MWENILVLVQQKTFTQVPAALAVNCTENRDFSKTWKNYCKGWSLPTGSYILPFGEALEQVTEAVAAPSKKTLKDRLDGVLSSKGRCPWHGRGLDQDGFYTLVSEPPGSIPMCSGMGESRVHSEQYSPLQGSCTKSLVINLPLILFHRSPFFPSRVKWHSIRALLVQMS